MIQTQHIFSPSMSQDPLDALLQQVTQGDELAIDALLEAHLPALLGYVRSHVDPMIRNHESCADIVQSVCREVLEEQDSFDYRGMPAFRKWLFTKALSKLINRKRFYLAEKRNPDREISPSLFSTNNKIEDLYASMYSPSQAAMAREDIVRLESAFAQLPADYQEVIRLSRFVGMSHAEIAQEMGRQEGAVRVLLHRALGRLGLLMHDDEAAS